MDTLRAVFFDPIFNALIALYNLLGDMGLAIIALTVIIKLVMLPLANKALRAQRRMQALQPELKKLQEKHKEDRETLAREMMAFYQKEGVSPASSCLPTLVQIPVLIALFFVFKDAVTGQHFDSLYSFVQNPGPVDTSTLWGVLDLSKNPNSGLALILPVVTGAAMFVQSKMMLPKGDDLPALNKQLLYLFPLLTAFFATTLPAALALYWLTTTVFTIAQQYVIMKELPEAKARAEAASDWNAANPADPVNGKKKKPRTKAGAQVTVRKRKRK